jgi:hypothetical protein
VRLLYESFGVKGLSMTVRRLPYLSRTSALNRSYSMISSFFSLILLSIQKTCNYKSSFFSRDAYLAENTVYLNYKNRSRSETIKERWSSCKKCLLYPILNNAGHGNRQKDVRKAVCNKTQRKTKIDFRQL